MRFKGFQWLLATTLVIISSVPGWAQAELVGEEFQVNQNRNFRQLEPVVAFSPAGHALIIWENEVHGIRGRFYDRNGSPRSAELKLVPNQELPTAQGSGEVVFRKEPDLVYLPNGEFLVFWTEEKDYVTVSYFYQDRQVLEQDVRGQRFSATGERLGASFLVNEVTAGFQRRPKAALRAGAVIVAWEAGSNTRAARSIHSRLLTRRGEALGSELRVDSGQTPTVRTMSMAAAPAGETLIAWEADRAGSPDVLARLLGRDGAPLGAEFVANPSTFGRQRRPAVLATRDGNFLVAWQSYDEPSSLHGIFGQLYSAAGARIGSEIKITGGIGDLQVSPILALLPTGDMVVTWMEWIKNSPVGLYTVAIDSAGRRIGTDIAITRDALIPHQSSIAANAQGDILAAWEKPVTRGRAIAARRLTDD
jgi:hypothetical protein